MAERFEMLDLWMALGLDSADFDPWMDEPRRTPADAWAQLVAAIAGNVESLRRDTNPPAGAELIAAARRVGHRRQRAAERAKARWN